VTEDFKCTIAGNAQWMVNIGQAPRNEDLRELCGEQGCPRCTHQIDRHT
jgi:hypothetical protein